MDKLFFAPEQLEHFGTGQFARAVGQIPGIRSPRILAKIFDQLVPLRVQVVIKDHARHVVRINRAAFERGLEQSARPPLLLVEGHGVGLEQTLKLVGDQGMGR